MSKRVTQADSIIEKADDLIRFLNNKWRQKPEALLNIHEENIESGLIGQLFFLLEVFELTGDQKYLNEILSYVRILVDSCKRNHTENYALYTGRSGLIYLMLNIYKITQDYTIVEDSIILVKQMRGFISNSKSVGFYRGLAGALLVVHYLYIFCGEILLLEYVENLLSVIIKHGNFCDDGIYWTYGEELYVKPAYGFGYGAAGISYVLRCLNRFHQNEALDFITSNADRYVESCRSVDNSYPKLHDEIKSIESLENAKTLQDYLNTHNQFPDFDDTWANGSIGIGFSFLNIQDAVTKEKKTKSIENRLEYIVHKTTFADSTLKCGKSGLGLYYCLTVSNKLIKENSNYTDLLSKQVFFSFENIDFKMDWSLMTGKLGEIYFATKYLRKSTDMDSILSPFLTEPKVQYPTARINISIFDVKRMLFEKFFKRTINLIKTTSIQQYAKLFDNKNDLNDARHTFRISVQDILTSGPNAPITELLTDVFNFESSKYQFICKSVKSRIAKYLQELENASHANAFFNNSRQWIETQSLELSKEISIVNSKWNWVMAKEVNYTENLYIGPSDHEVMFIDDIYSVLEMPLEISSLVIYQFKSKTKIRKAFENIRHFCTTQNKDFLDTLAKKTESSSSEEFLTRLENIFFFKIQELIYNQILKVCV